MDETELKPCPFCGGEAEIKEDSDTYFFRAWCECKKCHIQTRQWRVYTKKHDEKITSMLIDDCKRKLTEHWNNRT